MTWWQAVEGTRTMGDLPPLAGLTHDSRLVQPGWGFAALPGAQNDGHDYIEQALAAGATALVVQADHQAKWSRFAASVPTLVLPDVRASLGVLAAAVYGNPSAQQRLIGVTGTDGKTTTSHLAGHVLSACGLPCGYLTSVGFDTGEGFQPNLLHMTTLEPTLVQQKLAEALSGSRQAMVVEASSEGLAQHRLEGCQVDAAVFTNLTRDHLDFHGTMENYLAAKGLLFEMLGRPDGKRFGKVAVLNADQPSSEYLRGRSATRVLTYALQADADFRAVDIETHGAGLSFTVRHAGRSLQARLPMIGAFNVYNSLAVLALATSQGLALEDAIAALASFPGVPGRLQRIDAGQPFNVYVDIASTPAALQNVLNALQPATEGRLIVVFGAAGGRDPARRSGLGEVAGRLAGYCVLTSEDPREEDPEAIIDAIAGALIAQGRSEGADFVRIVDREGAVRHAFSYARPGDSVLLAGKATEATMVIGRQSIPWDEPALALRLLREL